jgi:hypothetical protein
MFDLHWSYVWYIGIYSPTVSTVSTVLQAQNGHHRTQKVLFIIFYNHVKSNPLSAMGNLCQPIIMYFPININNERVKLDLYKGITVRGYLG